MRDLLTILIERYHRGPCAAPTQAHGQVFAWLLHHQPSLWYVDRVAQVVNRTPR
jgi:hypothetical protein